MKITAVRRIGVNSANVLMLTRYEVAGIVGHGTFDIWVGFEEHGEVRMVLEVRGIINERRPIGQRPCDIWMLLSKVAPRPQTVQIEVASAGGLEDDGSVTTHHPSEHVAGSL